MKILRKSLIFFMLLLNTMFINAQKVVNVSFPSEGFVQLSDDITIPRIDAGYTLWMPNTGKIQGMIVFFHARRDTASQDVMIKYAVSKQLAVLYATTNNPLEFFFKEAKMEEIASYISNVCTNFKIPTENLLFCGMSLAGTRALKMTIFIKQTPRYSHISPKAIAICDSPIDMFRFYESAISSAELNFEPISTNERKWVAAYLRNNLDGTPEQSLANYIQYSPYAKSVRNGGNAGYFKYIPLRAYTEPDIHWWIENRRKDYYDMNSFDLAGFVDQLYILGSESAELITTENKGVLPDGTRHPYSWSIVDEKELLDWFLTILKSGKR